MNIPKLQTSWSTINWLPDFSKVTTDNRTEAQKRADARAQAAREEAKKQYGIVTESDRQEAQMQANREKVRKADEREQNYQKQKAQFDKEDALPWYEDLAGDLMPVYNTYKFAKKGATDLNRAISLAGQGYIRPALGYGARAVSNVLFGATTLVPFVGEATSALASGERQLLKASNLAKREYAGRKIANELNKNIKSRTKNGYIELSYPELFDNNHLYRRTTGPTEIADIQNTGVVRKSSSSATTPSTMKRSHGVSGWVKGGPYWPNQNYAIAGWEDPHSFLVVDGTNKSFRVGSSGTYGDLVPFENIPVYNKKLPFKSAVGVDYLPEDPKILGEEITQWSYTPQGTYKYEGRLIPNKVVSFSPSKPPSAPNLANVRELSEIERLGIPKGERTSYLTGSNADPSYFAGIGLNNPRYLQRLRDLHFVEKAGLTGINEGAGLQTMYHGSPSQNLTGFLAPNRKIGGRATNGLGYYVTDNPAYAERYTVPHLMRNNTKTGKIYPVYVKSVNPYDIHYNPEKFTIPITDVSAPTTESMQKYWKAGYRDLYDIRGFGKTGNKLNSEYVVFDPERIKSAEAITYDINGNIIPLSQRDIFLRNDIRYKSGGRLNYLDFFN